MTTWAEKEAAIRALERQGKVNPVDLIEAAKSPDHPCHNDFTWDIQAAAEERWRDQARAMIRRCKFDVVYKDVTTPGGASQSWRSLHGMVRCVAFS